MPSALRAPSCQSQSEACGRGCRPDLPPAHTWTAAYQLTCRHTNRHQTHLCIGGQELACDSVHQPGIPPSQVAALLLVAGPLLLGVLHPCGVSGGGLGWWIRLTHGRPRKGTACPARRALSHREGYSPRPRPPAAHSRRLRAGSISPAHLGTQREEAAHGGLQQRLLGGRLVRKVHARQRAPAAVGAVRCEGGRWAVDRVQESSVGRKSEGMAGRQPSSDGLEGSTCMCSFSAPQRDPVLPQNEPHWFTPQPHLKPSGISWGGKSRAAPVEAAAAEERRLRPLPRPVGSSSSLSPSPALRCPAPSPSVSSPSSPPSPYRVAPEGPALLARPARRRLVPSPPPSPPACGCSSSVSASLCGRAEEAQLVQSSQQYNQQQHKACKHARGSRAAAQQQQQQPWW